MKHFSAKFTCFFNKDSPINYDAFVNPKGVLTNLSPLHPLPAGRYTGSPALKGDVKETAVTN